MLLLEVALCNRGIKWEKIDEHVKRDIMNHISLKHSNNIEFKEGKMGKEPDVAEFISAIAGGNNAQFMVEACGSIAGPTTVGLVAAAQQTGGHVVCILPGPKELGLSKSELSRYSDRVEFVTGIHFTC